MAQVKSKKTKRKTVVNKPKVENIVNDELTNNADFDIIDDEPEVKLVNEKNEIIYDGESELEKIYEKLNYKTDIELNDLSKQAIDEIKKATKLIEESDPLNNNVSNENIEAAIETLSEFEKKLEKDINDINSSLTKEQKDAMNKVDFTSIWSGIKGEWF